MVINGTFFFWFPNYSEKCFSFTLQHALSLPGVPAISRLLSTAVVHRQSLRWDITGDAQNMANCALFKNRTCWLQPHLPAKEPCTLGCLLTSRPDVTHANYFLAFHTWGWKHQAMNDRWAAYKNSTYKQIGNNESLEDIKVLNSLPCYFLFSQTMFWIKLLTF